MKKDEATRLDVNSRIVLDDEGPNGIRLIVGGVDIAPAVKGDATFRINSHRQLEVDVTFVANNYRVDMPGNVRALIERIEEASA